MIRNLLGETNPYCDDLVEAIYYPSSTIRSEICYLSVDEYVSFNTLLRKSFKHTFISKETMKVMSLNEVIEFFRGLKEIGCESFMLMHLHQQESGLAIKVIENMSREQLINDLEYYGRLKNYDGNLLTLAKLCYKGLE